MSQLTTCLFALEPDEGFSATVMAYKIRTGELVGPQLYLEDPPHVTLYLSTFPVVGEVVTASAATARTLQAPTAIIQGWHVFRNDPLTGNQTLVCQIDPEQSQNLFPCQQRLVEAVSPLRDREASRVRYRPWWHRLSSQERENVERWGFPFLGAIWQPHVTVASIRLPDWGNVWPKLAADPPSGTVRFPSLNLYALAEDRTVLLERFILEMPR